MVGKNKKAFTLVEVLTVIVILGILSSIGIVTITNIRKNQEKKFNQTQYELFRETAKTYFSDNKSQLPTISGGTSEVYLDELINDNYLDSLLDYDKNSYQKDKSYVQVKKLGSKYNYIAYLYQEGKDAPTLIVPEEKNPSDIQFPNYRKDTTNTIMKVKSNTHYTNSTAKVYVTITDEDGIMAYNYSIYKNDKKIYTSEYIEPNSPSTSASDTITLNANDYEDGTYIIKFTVYDNGNHVVSRNSEKIMIDRTKPSCSTTKTPTATWTNQDVTIKGTCSDTKGKANSGCVDSTITKNYTTEMSSTKSPGSVEDYAGNKTVCNSVSVNIDKTPPRCSTTKTPTATWTNQDVTIKGSCYDTKGKVNSGCIKSSVTKPYTTEGSDKISPGTVKDRAGNTFNCDKIAVNIDKTPPTVNIKAASQNANYNTTKATVTVNIDDTNSTRYELSTLNYPSKTYDNLTTKSVNGDNTTNMDISSAYDGSQKTIYVTVKDIAGNETKKQTSYTVYALCSRTNRTDSGFGACSVGCGGGTQNNTITQTDSFFGTVCSTQTESRACNTQPCCTGPTTTYTGWSACNVACGSGTQTRIKTVTQCDGTSSSTTESQVCNTGIDCCSSYALSACSVSCGVGIKTATSNYNGMPCPSKNETCKDRSCSKNTCYVGNTLYSVNVHWPYNAGKVGYGDCPKDTEAYWFYCSDKDGKLWTNLKRNTYYSGNSQWACKSNNLGDKVGQTVKISGKSYKVINDSDSFWKKCSNSCYYGTCK